MDDNLGGSIGRMEDDLETLCHDCGATDGRHKNECPEAASGPYDVSIENEVLREQNFAMNATIARLRRTLQELIACKDIEGESRYEEEWVVFDARQDAAWQAARDAI